MPHESWMVKRVVQLHYWRWARNTPSSRLKVAKSGLYVTSLQPSGNWADRSLSRSSNRPLSHADASPVTRHIVRTVDDLEGRLNLLTPRCRPRPRCGTSYTGSCVIKQRDSSCRCSARQCVRADTQAIRRSNGLEILLLLITEFGYLILLYSGLIHEYISPMHKLNCLTSYISERLSMTSTIGMRCSAQAVMLALSAIKSWRILIST